ncbi:MAG: hypothetical protein PHX51_02745 [Clostridia bacterium]|nr:hypothetical protein [Clostridia bacterium]
MINELVKSIVEAEAEAARRVQVAQDESKSLVFSAESEAEKIRAEGVAEIKRLSGDRTKNANTLATAKADKLRADGFAENSRKISACAKNTDKAVKYIVGRVVD